MDAPSLNTTNPTPAPPRKLTFEITKKCFNECIYCSAYVSEENAKKVLSINDAKRTIDQFIQLGGQELNISGGEPLLHPNWFDITTYAKNKGLKVRLFTCGILSDKPISLNELSNTIDMIAKVGFEAVEMTLHAPYSEMHDQITSVEGSFKDTYRFIKLLSSKVDNLEINFVPTQINADELEELVDFVAKLGIKKLNVLRFIPQGKGLTNKELLSLKKDQSARLVKVIMELSKRNDIDVNLGHPSDFIFLLDNSHKPKSCSAGKEQCMIKINGDVVPCPAFGDLDDWVAGNIFKERFETIWNESTVFIRLRKFDFKRIQGDCKVCVHLKFCQGRCPAQRIRENGDLYKGPDPECPKDYISKRPYSLSSDKHQKNEE